MEPMNNKLQAVHERVNTIHQLEIDKINLMEAVTLLGKQMNELLYKSQMIKFQAAHKEKEIERQKSLLQLEITDVQFALNQSQRDLLSGIEAGIKSVAGDMIDTNGDGNRLSELQ